MNTTPTCPGAAAWTHDTTDDDNGIPPETILGLFDTDVIYWCEECSDRETDRNVYHARGRLTREEIEAAVAGSPAEMFVPAAFPLMLDSETPADRLAGAIVDQLGEPAARRVGRLILERTGKLR